MDDATVDIQTPDRHPPGPLSYAEYLDWLSPETHAEWVAGEVRLMSPVSAEHSLVQAFLLTVMQCWVDARQLGHVLAEPYQMKTGPALPGRSPDLLFVSAARRAQLTEHFLDGPADLVVEIVSPSSCVTDRGDKYYEYEAGGVREYWLVDPDRLTAEFYQAEEGVFRPVLADSHGVYISRELAGLRLRVAWLWDRPGALVVLRDLGLTP